MVLFVESSERHESRRNKKAKACNFLSRTLWLLSVMGLDAPPF